MTEELQLKPKTIKCKKCGKESYIELWKVEIEDGELVRVCPLCNSFDII